MARWQRWGRRWRSLLLGGATLAAVLTGTGRPSLGAEDIIVAYGFFERTIPIEDLVAFAEGRGLSRQLEAYARLFNLSDEDLAQIQQVLNQPISFDSDTINVNESVAIAQFLYTDQGEALLELLGQVVQTPSRQSGFYALRAGLILAAAEEPPGLTVLTFLAKYPTPALRVDVIRGLAIADQIKNTVGTATAAINWVHTQAALTASEEPESVVLTARQLARDAPPYGASRSEVEVSQRRLRANLYLPTPIRNWPPLPAQAPVVVISHGLGDNRYSYDYLGRYLAQQGFVVAVLDHPGSNSDQILSLLTGFSSNLVSDEEFIQRPQDITALLDTLESQLANNSVWRDRVDFQNVGVVGQSFGGYTALALGGATLQPDALANLCAPQVVPVNPSLLLQCQAVSIPTAPDLQDDRVQAVLAINPVGSALLGPNGYGNIDVPTLMVAGVADTVAPALPEQIRPFSWLQTPERYLVVIGNATHFSMIDAEAEDASVALPPGVIGPNPQITQAYLEVLSLGFFKTYLEGDSRYQTILTSRYLQDSLATDPFVPISLIRDLPPGMLEQALSPQ
jgi:predicted dienelactone hydrolase